MEHFDYSEALKQMKEGNCVARTDWVHRNQFIFMIEGDEFYSVLRNRLGKKPTGVVITNQIWIKTSKKTAGPYTPCNCDTMATDWVILN